MIIQPRNTAVRFVAAVVAVVAVVALALAGLAGAPAGAAARAADTTSFCGLTGFSSANTFVWTGAAGDGDWSNGDNWNHGTVPGQEPPDFTDDVAYVCIGSGAHVTLPAGDSAALSALDLDETASLTLDEGSKLFLNSTDSSHPSFLRSHSTLLVQGASLGGHATVRDYGSLELESVSGGATTVTTRYCDEYAAPCSAGAVTGAGSIVVEHGGSLDVTGTAGGINLEDGYLIDNAGTVRVKHAGYISADDGTHIVNEHHGTFKIENNRGVYEGRLGRYGSTADTFTNGGTLEKASGTGAGIIGAAFTSTHGSVRVKHGSLDIAGNKVPAAVVAQGSSYGAGACAPSPQDYCTSAVVSSDDPQIEQVVLPGGKGSGRVSITETSSRGAPAGSLGKPVHIVTSGTSSSAKHPLRFVFTLSGATVHDRSLSTLHVDSTGSGSHYKRLPTCRSNGTPPSGHSSCLDLRKHTSGASHRDAKTGDVTLVVRTSLGSRFVVV